ncbi:MAG TPA: hypothetical protein VFX15_14025 [Actinomycetes bacterium]|nr:hypothetical protein [Actinomycetes bacterium]
MGVMVVCAVAVVAALGLAFRWRQFEFAPDPTAAGRPGTSRLTGLARVLTVGSLSGLATGALFIGPAGRLVMRLLAATSPNAQGRLTEAEEVVGRITVGGTIDFILFVGLPAGFAVGLVYPFVARAFPRGLLGGAIYGLALLVLFSWFLDPLRSSNPDFDIVGPGWLAVMAFTVMAVLTGAVVVALAGRVDKALDGALGERSWRWLLMVPVALLAVISALVIWPASIVVVVGSLVYLFVPSRPQEPSRVRRWALPTVVFAAVLLALPAFLSSVIDIA